MSIKQDVVSRMESKFAIHIFDGAYHVEDCRCPHCINLLWDALVIKSEKILADMKVTFGEVEP